MLQMVYTLPIFIFHSNVARNRNFTRSLYLSFENGGCSRSCPWIVVTRDTMQNQLARKFQHGESYESRSKELRKIGKDSRWVSERVSEVTCPLATTSGIAWLEPLALWQTTSSARSTIYSVTTKRIFIG